MQLIITTSIAAIFAILWLITAYLFYRVKKQPKNMTQDAQALLSDIFSSGAIVRVEVLDPKNLLYHRTR
jgi:hypothetical protein